MRLIVLVALCLTCTSANAGKKLVEYGWDVPDTAFVRQHAAEMEKVPFDGVVIQVVSKTEGQIGWKVFSKTKTSPEVYQQAIDDLKAAKFKRFTDNFIQVIAYPADVDWFDSDWGSIAENAAALARVAKLSGCKGIMFDPEHYSEHHIWNFQSLPKNHTYEEYAAKIKERGREFIRAINKEYPDLTILTLYGSSLPYLQSQPGGLEKADYGLLAAFYDGMYEAASPGTTLVDGFESSYGYRERKLFEDGRDTVLRQSKTISTEPKAFAKHVRCGFGVWADNGGAPIGWHPDDFSKNYYTPAGLRASLAYALETSDGYVWVYSERLKWWDFNVPQQYLDALALAKKGPGSGEKNPLKMTTLAPKAASQEGYSDEETFAEFRKTMAEVYDFPKDGWRFKRDESERGQKKGWFKVGFDDSGWRTISIAKFWEEQGEEYDGKAWYRLKFTSPAIEPGKQIFLAVGAADESAWAWLNGKSIGVHDIGGAGWTVPFALDVTSVLNPRMENALAIMVHDRGFAGGLWKSIKLMAK